MCNMLIIYMYTHCYCIYNSFYKYILYYLHGLLLVHISAKTTYFVKGNNQSCEQSCQNTKVYTPASTTFTIIDLNINVQLFK